MSPETIQQSISFSYFFTPALMYKVLVPGIRISEPLCKMTQRRSRRLILCPVVAGIAEEHALPSALKLCSLCSTHSRAELLVLSQAYCLPVSPSNRGFIVTWKSDLI